MSDPLKPSVALLCKIGSVVGHCQEMLSADGHHFDKDALDSLLNDDEVQAWLTEMEALALIPLKRRRRKP